MSRCANAILSTENLLHNLQILKEKSPNCQVIAMIKANAYGHGLRSTAMRLEKHVFSLGVASVDEAIALRKVGIKIPITLMAGAFEADDLLVASCENFHVVFHDQSQILWLLKQRLPKKIYIWLKINTGMGRLGFSLEQAHQIYAQLNEIEYVEKPIGIMSHMACADEVDNELNSLQIDAFREFTTHYPKAKKTLANSAAIINFQDSLCDVVRPGISLYGYSPIKGTSAASLGLKPVMSLQTKLITINNFKKGQSIGYGSQFICPQDMPIGVIAIGYGDGYPRTARNGTPVLVNNTLCAIVGRVSMDMITIDLRNNKSANVGDVVTLWGEGLPLEDVALNTQNSVYDIICAIQHRVKFYWTM
jgi:alanine racemase